MPFNGSGVYSAPSLPGSFNPATGGQNATPDAWNTLLADISTALSTTITRDGQSTISQNIPFNNKKITGLATGTAGTDAVNLTQVLALIRQVPVIKSSNFALDPATDLWVINNKAGSPLVVTLPAAATYPGLVCHFQNYLAFAIESSVSNIRSVEGNPLGITIVSAVAGNWATIVSDGTNWRATQRGT